MPYNNNDTSGHIIRTNNAHIFWNRNKKRENWTNIIYIIDSIYKIRNEMWIYIVAYRSFSKSIQNYSTTFII